MRIGCDFGNIDVTRGRRALEKRLKAGERVRLLVEIELDTDPRSWSDDGVSIDFSGTVHSVREIGPDKRG